MKQSRSAPGFEKQASSKCGCSLEGPTELRIDLALETWDCWNNQKRENSNNFSTQLRDLFIACQKNVLAKKIV